MVDGLRRMIARRLGIFFALIFFIGFLTQMVIWSYSNFGDGNLWVSRVESLTFDISNNILHISQSNFSGHPGMAAVTVASLFHLVGFSSEISLDIGVSFFVALATAGAVIVSFSMRPKLWWWLPVMSLMLGHPVYTEVTPTNAVIAPIITLFFLMTMWRFKVQGQRGYLFFFLYGLVIGVALATRMPVSAVVVFFGIVALYKAINVKQLFVVIISTSFFLLLFDPLMLLIPIEHLNYITSRVRLHAMDGSVVQMHIPSLLIIIAPSCLSIISLVILWIFRNDIKFPIPKRIAVYVLAVTLLMSAIFLLADLGSIRYFFPLAMIWEVLLFLLLLHWVEWRRKDVELVLLRADKSKFMIALSYQGQCLLIGICASISIFILLMV